MSCKATNPGFRSLVCLDWGEFLCLFLCVLLCYSVSLFSLVSTRATSCLMELSPKWPAMIVSSHSYVKPHFLLTSSIAEHSIGFSELFLHANERKRTVSWRLCNQRRTFVLGRMAFLNSSTFALSTNVTSMLCLSSRKCFTSSYVQPYNWDWTTCHPRHQNNNYQRHEFDLKLKYQWWALQFTRNTGETITLKAEKVGVATS